MRIIHICWFLLLSVLASCPRGKPPEPGPGSRPTIVTIKGNQFNGGTPVTIKPGDYVVWVNEDDMTHTATSDEESTQDFDTGYLKPGQRSEPIRFMRASPAGGFPYHCEVHTGMKGNVLVAGSTSPVASPGEPAGVSGGHPNPGHEGASTHSMVVSGLDPDHLFLNHIALFNDPDHAYQVILEATFADAAARQAYREYRAANGDARCAAEPEHFRLPELKGTRHSFKASVYNAPLGGNEADLIPGLSNVTINVLRIIHFRAFDPKAKYPPRLTYELYGNDKEAFLSHIITKAPDFQETIKLAEVPSYVPAEKLRVGTLVNMPAKHLREGAALPLKTAILDDGTNQAGHLILAPPTNSSPREPLAKAEVVEVLVDGDATVHKMTIATLLFFDFRILNK